MQHKPLTDEDLDVIMTEMFTRVGEDYATLKAQGFLKQPDWYTQRHWSEQEQEDFAQWLSVFLKAHKYAKGRYRNQDAGYHLAWKFLMDFGWTTVDKPKGWDDPTANPLKDIQDAMRVEEAKANTSFSLEANERVALDRMKHRGSISNNKSDKNK